jgi:cell fate regulator YaaT (PSP1 superfamily)
MEEINNNIQYPEQGKMPEYRPPVADDTLDQECNDDNLKEIQQVRKDLFGTNPFMSRGCCSMVSEDGCSNFNHGCSKLDAFDWLESFPPAPGVTPFDCVEVRFKNSRKDYFRAGNDLDLHVGDIVAVEANPGHDIGIVTLTGEVVRHQMKRRNIDPSNEDLKKVYRKARPGDIEKWIHAVMKEDKSMFRTREIAAGLNLKMKVNDVEYQGDDTKAIFYYTADERVDFRELIKILAEEFRVRIEMRQIGARQEASRLGGIGSCGRELCCSTWLTSFSTVSTNAARIQQLSLNPQKLAGQCGKLKCCLNYEYAAYAEALKDFPPDDTILNTTKGDALPQKVDVFGGVMWYAYKSDPNNLLAIPVEKVKEIIIKNRKGQNIPNLEDYARKIEKQTDFERNSGEEDLTRFDKIRQ